MSRPGYYAHRGQTPPTGTLGQSIRRDLKTDRGAVAWAKRLYGTDCRLYRFANFYDDKTFKEVPIR